MGDWKINIVLLPSNYRLILNYFLSVQCVLFASNTCVTTESEMETENETDRESVIDRCPQHPVTSFLCVHVV